MNPADVTAWREALVRLSDQHFFDLLRMYLGAIKTPFNKQRLVEELSSFLRKKENRANLVLGLDDLELLILSAIGELPEPTQPKIIKLLSGTWTFPVLYEKILNLEERLIIYRRNDSDSREYALNPLLADEILPLLDPSRLVPPESRGEPLYVHPRIDDLSLSALYSFFLHEGEAVKNDGSFRKKTLTALETIFPQLHADSGCLPYLLSAFQNLGLLVKLEGRLVPDPSRWQSFARITRAERIAYLVAAAGGRYQRDTLQQRAQIFMDFLASLESGALYKKETVSRLAYLLSEKSGRVSPARPQGRFASILREQEAAAETQAHTSGTDYAGIAFAFGLLVESEGLWAPNSAAVGAGEGNGDISEGNPYLVVSPSFTVTLMPGYSLSELLPLAQCMEILDMQIAAQFEITRKSCAAAFDQGATADSVSSLFRDRSAQSVPQGVLFSIGDWYRNYASVSLYHGYVLRVDESRRILFENNGHLSALIRKTLAPGLYLLDADSPEEIQEAFSQADLDFLPAVSLGAPKRESLPLPALRSPSPRKDSGQGTVPARPSGRFAVHQARLAEALDALSLGADFHEALKSRIERKIILTPAQLDPDSVRIEKIEARGMDFLGKVRIAEYALVSGSLLEIAFDEKEGNRMILGRPVSTEKKTGDVLLKIATEPDGVVEEVSLGKAILVRRIRGSIFSELPAGRGQDRPVR